MHRQVDEQDDVWKPTGIDFGDFRKPIEFFKERVGGFLNSGTEETASELLINHAEQWTSWLDVLLSM